MTELEKVEKLREKADISFAEAKEALDAANGDLLEALIYLETHGKAIVPAGGGFFSGAGAADPDWQHAPGDTSGGGSGGNTASAGESFGDMLKRFGKFCLAILRKGNRNFLEATKGGERMFTCPVTVVILFLLFFFWVTVPLFIISLFFGFRYSFRGAELGRASVNRVMDSATDVVEDVKKSFAEKANNDNNDNNEQ